MDCLAQMCIAALRQRKANLQKLVIVIVGSKPGLKLDWTMKPGLMSEEKSTGQHWQQQTYLP